MSTKSIIEDSFLASHTRVCVKTYGGMEPFPMFQNIQGQSYVIAFPFLLNSQQCSLQVEPETNLL